MKQIVYTCTESGITPSVPQKAGVQGDCKATEIIFDVTAIALPDTPLFRIEVADGSGHFTAYTDLTVTDDVIDEATHKRVHFLVPLLVTDAGGMATMHLVISNETEVMYTYPAMLSFKGSTYGSDTRLDYTHDMSDMLQYASDLIGGYQGALLGKVDKVEGKGLSTNDYTNTDKALVQTIPDKANTSDVNDALENKVDKVPGKRLSTNDYTSIDRLMVQTISGKANVVTVNQQLEGKVDKVDGKGLSTNDFTNAEKTKLANLQNYDDAEVREEISNKQDKLTAGDNIEIDENNVISATGGGSENNYVTPQQFGAKGDGTTNDTDAIQSALNYAFSNKMSVYFKGGTYKITNKLIIPDETKIFGDGRKSIIKSTISDGYVLQGTNVNDDTSIRHCSFDSICFENGNIADVDTHLIQGDFVGKIYGGYFNNCTISKYYNVFDHISNCTYLINCRFTTIYNCFMNASVDSVIDGCYINASTYSISYGSKAFGHSFNSTSLTNSIIDYFCDVFAISSINNGTIEGNTFNRCETIFHDTFQRIAVSNNIFSVVNYVIKFDDLVQSATNHLMSNIVFCNNVGIDVDYYFYVANGVNVIPAKCEFRGNRISVSSNGTMSNVDVGFRNTSTTETTYNSMKDVYFDFWDLKTFENGLPSANLRGGTAKSVVSFPFMRAINEGKLFTNIDGRWFCGEGGTVDDVKVDGVSVVSSGIANIDLSGKANANDVYTKQEVNTRLQTKAPLSDVDILFDTIGNVPETTTVQAEIEQKSDKTTIITSSDTTATVELLNNSEYRYMNALSNFTITFPAEIPNDYITSVMFYSIGVPTNLTYPSGIKWSGDDIVSGEFVPASGKKYTLCLWYDGVVNGVVRGVTNA